MRLLLILIALLNTLSSKTIVVDDSSTPCEEGDSGCNGRCNFNRVASALDYFESGDTIRICSGNYQEPTLIIDRKSNGVIESVTGDAEDVNITSDSSGNLFLIKGWIENFTLRGVTLYQNSSSYDAISIEDGSNIKFSNLKIESKRDGISQRGVDSSRLDGIEISSSSIKANQYSIYLKNPSNLLIDDVNITSDYMGIVLETPENSVTITDSKGGRNYIDTFDSSIHLGNQEQIVDNRVEHTDFKLKNSDSASITFTKVYNLSVDDIRVYANSKGVGVWSSGEVSGDLNISRSRIYDSKNEAIYIKSVKGSTYILDNEISNAGIDCIRVDDSLNGGVIERNIIKGADSYGLRLLSQKVSRGFQIDHNCFMDNGVNAISQDSGAKFDDGSEGNYWDDWSGSGSYRVENIPKYDEHPLSECNITIGGVGGGDTNFNAVSSIGDDGVCNSISDWDNNLTTQIVDRDFDLYILSRDDSGAVASDANVSRVILNYYKGGDENSCSGDIYKSLTLCDGDCGNTDLNGCLHLSGIKSDRAVKCVEVEIIGRVLLKNVDDTSSDDFAIRPSKYSILLDRDLAYAGDSFKMQIDAVDSGGDKALDYNESEDSSFRVTFKDTKSDCITGDTQRDKFEFSDGESANLDVTYSEIGDINISIEEIEGEEFASVDRDDSNDSVRFIESNTTILQILPYEINITASSFPTSTDARWLYDANSIDEVYSEPTAKVSVFNRGGNLMEDFNSSCYGRDLNVTFKYSVDGATDANLTLDGNLTSYENSIDDINKSVIVHSSEFSGGEANATYRFGIDRDYSKPINPINIKLEDITVDTDGVSKYRHSAKEASSLPSEDSIIFYYGRVKFDDMRVNNSPVTQKGYFEIYSNNPDSSYISGFSRDSLNWYLNSNHNSSRYGTVYIDRSGVYRGMVIDDDPLNAEFKSISFNGDGSADLTIDIAEGVNGVAHIDIDRWLWYIPSEFGSDYNFSNGSSCSEHSCFNISRDRLESKDRDAIESGNYNGLDFNGSNRGKYDIKGVKLFR